jgi:hypothetical protein
MKKSHLKRLIKESIKPLNERYLNFFDKEELRPYIDEVFDIMQRTYEPIGGFKTARTPEELLSKAGFAKLVRKEGRIVAAAVYKDQRGRKAIAKGYDGSEIGKRSVVQIYKEDAKMNRSWGEFSGKPEAIMLKYGAVPVHNDAVEAILGKPIESKDADGFHYIRLIKGEPYRKILIGNVK